MFQSAIFIGHGLSPAKSSGQRDSGVKTRGLVVFQILIEVLQG